MKQRFHYAQPLLIERLPANRLSCSVVPIYGVALIAFLAMEVGMHPRASDAFVLLRTFVSAIPVAFGVPPQPSEGVRQPDWRLGRGEGLTELVEGHNALNCND